MCARHRHTGSEGPALRHSPAGCGGAWITVPAASRVTEGRRDSQGQRCDPVGVGAVGRALSLVLGVGAGAGRGAVREAPSATENREQGRPASASGRLAPWVSGEASFKALQVQSSGSRLQY